MIAYKGKSDSGLLSQQPNMCLGFGFLTQEAFFDLQQNIFV
jgi:hypothetical protein